MSNAVGITAYGGAMENGGINMKIKKEEFEQFIEAGNRIEMYVKRIGYILYPSYELRGMLFDDDGVEVYLQLDEYGGVREKSFNLTLGMMKDEFLEERLEEGLKIAEEIEEQLERERRKKIKQQELERLKEKAEEVQKELEENII